VSEKRPALGPRVFDPARHCGAASKRDGKPCRLGRGFRTDHTGSGHCFLHLGTTPNGKKSAALERAAKAAELLGHPVGNGDPFDLLTSAVQHEMGQLQGTAALVREAIAAEEGATKLLDVEAAMELHGASIRSAFRGGKAVVDAKVAERGAVLEEAAFDLLKAFLDELLERVPKTARPQLQAWAATRLAELSEAVPASVVH
jgi:hypothetical protein